MDLKDKVAVITGASRGLGAGLADEFAKRGMRLGLCSRGEPVEIEGIDAVARRRDVRSFDDVDAFVREVEAELGPIDLWVNNAGVLEPIAPLRDVTPEQFEEHVAINLAGVFHGTKAYVEHLHRTDHRGVLINVSSGAARKPYHGWAPYCAAKAGVDRMTECVAVEEHERLRAYSIAPGVIDTDMQALIRSTSEERFPELPRFKTMKEEDAFSTARWVASEFLSIAFERDEVEVLLRLETGK